MGEAKNLTHEEMDKVIRVGIHDEEAGATVTTYEFELETGIAERSIG